MAIPAGTIKVVLSGTLNGGEIWETGFWLSGPANATAAELNALAKLVADEMTIASPAGGIAALMGHFADGKCAFTEVRTYLYQGGTTASVIGTYTVPQTATTVGVGSPKQPDQCCIVLTLRSDLAGRRHRGRMYLPVQGATLGTDGEVAKSETDTVTAAFARSFDAIGKPGSALAIVSQVGVGDVTLVSSVTMDTRLDIQRRRANRQVITARSVAALTP